MSELTSKFEIQLREAQERNKQLSATVEKMKVKEVIDDHLTSFSQEELVTKEDEAREAAEVATMYATKLSKMEKKMKEEMEKEDESYIEITIPYSLL